MTTLCHTGSGSFSARASRGLARAAEKRFLVNLVWAVGLLLVAAPRTMAVSARGGLVTEYTDHGTNFVAHIFKPVGTNVLKVTVEGIVEVLVVGGGGGGAGSVKNGTGTGGGRGGGLVCLKCRVPIGRFAVTVGAGGAGGVSGAYGTPGQASLFSTLKALGGEGGAAKKVGTSPETGSAGRQYTLTGSAATYAVDGFGRHTTALQDRRGASGAANTGNGGRGAAGNTALAGESGGSGIVVIRYPVADGNRQPEADDPGLTTDDDVGKNNRLTSFDPEVAVTVAPMNEAPVASPRVDPDAGLVTDTFQFEAGESIDTDGEIVRYEWRIRKAVVSTNAEFSHTFATTGTYVAVLTVWDNGGASATGTVRVLISRPPPTAYSSDVIAKPNAACDIELYASRPDPQGGEPSWKENFKFVIVSNTQHGVLSSIVSNHIYYTPATGYVGPDQFMFKVSDGELESTLALIDLTVTNAWPEDSLPQPPRKTPPKGPHGSVPAPTITPSGGFFDQAVMVNIVPPEMTPLTGIPGWRAGVRFPGAGMEQVEARSYDGQQVLAIRARTVCSNRNTFASVNLSPEAGAPIPLYIWSLADCSGANYPPELLVGVTDNLRWDGRNHGLSSSNNGNRVYLHFVSNTHGTGEATPELRSVALGKALALPGQTLAKFDPFVIARFDTEPLLIEYAGEKVRVTVDGRPLTCAATDDDGWVTYTGDAASGRVTAPLGATRFWVSLAGGYATGTRELVLADWPKPETEVRYTADNTPVTEASPLVQGPLRVTTEMTLRARCFSSPLQASAETSAAFSRATQAFPAKSFVSPLYLPVDYERFDGSIPKISMDGPSGTIAAGIGRDLRYPLNPVAPTPLTLHRSGASDLTGRVVWCAVQLDRSAPDMRICREDSLLLSAGKPGQTGTMRIVVTDASNQVYRATTNAPGDRMPFRFDRVGVFRAVAYINGASVGGIAISVVYVDIKGPIAIQVGRSREKAILLAGPANEVFFTGNDSSLLDVKVIAKTAKGVKLSLTSHKRGSPVLQVRLGSPTGPVVAQQPVDEFTLSSSSVPGIVVVDDQPARVTLRVHPYVPNLIINFAMSDRYHSTFHGGRRSFRVNTSDATASTGEPGFRSEYDSNTGEYVGIFNYALILPPDEGNYSYTSNPSQLDDGEETTVH
ncbi:MAG: PKD domain-containing protein [Kiritimatiellia bacterium]